MDFQKVHQGIPIQPGHEIPGPKGIGSNGFPLVNGFVKIGHGPAFDQVHQGIRNHGGMNAQVAFVRQLSAQGFEQRTDGKCDTAFVLNQGTDAVSDHVEYRSGFPAVKIDGIIPGKDEHVKFRYIDERVSKGSRDLRVDFADHETGLFHGGPGHINGNPQAGIAGTVRLGDLYKRRIHLNPF